MLTRLMGMSLVLQKVTFLRTTKDVVTHLEGYTNVTETFCNRLADIAGITGKELDFGSSFWNNSCGAQ